MPSPETQGHLESVAANVRRLRARVGLTQAQLAERINVESRTMQKIEHAEINITLETLVRLGSVLGVTPGVLLRKSTLAPAKRGRPKKRRRLGER